MTDEHDFFGGAPEDSGEEPIVLAPPEDQPIFLGEAPPPPEEEMLAPSYLGDVNEAPMMDTGDAPIVLGGPSEDEDEPVGVPESSEPSPMTKWNDEWQVTLVERKDAENARKAELLEASRIALEQFLAEREVRREAKMATNRQNEQEKLEAIEADLENDNSWQRVCKMVELSHDSTAQAQDVKRMRDMLIFLKNTQGKAEALS